MEKGFGEMKAPTIFGNYALRKGIRRRIETEKSKHFWTAFLAGYVTAYSLVLSTIMALILFA